MLLVCPNLAIHVEQHVVVDCTYCLIFRYYFSIFIIQLEHLLKDCNYVQQPVLVHAAAVIVIDILH